MKIKTNITAIGAGMVRATKTMGQYYKGKKIGTCESMYYMKLQEAQELAAMGARDDDGIPFADYLKDGATRFRFPFPEEDGFTRGEMEGVKYDKGFNIPAGGIDAGHNRIGIHNEHRGGTHGINIFIPCPHSAEFKATGLETSCGGAGEQFLQVKMQGMRRAPDSDGPLQCKTIFACARCGQEQWFTDDDIVKVKERATEYFKVYDCTDKGEGYGGNQGLYDYAMKIIERIS